MARSMASISTWVSMNLIRARSAFSRSKGAARVLAKASRSSVIRSRAFINVSSRSLISAQLSVGRVIWIGAKRNWHKTHDDRIAWSDVAGGRLSPARDEPFGPDDGAVNQRRYHRENCHRRHDNIKPEYLAAVLNEVAKADAGRLKLTDGDSDQRQTRIDLERRDHRGNAAGQNDLGQDLRLAGAKCSCELDLVDFNTLKATVDHWHRDEQGNRKRHHKAPSAQAIKDQGFQGDASMHAYEIPAAVKERVVNRMGKLTVNETIDASRCAFIVIDMQNYF